MMTIKTPTFEITSEADTLGGVASSWASGWGAVIALSLCAAALVASEFMPVSLLTPIASDLRITEGQAGQAIAVSGIFAFCTSLLISSATRGIDRRVVLLGLTVAMMVSGAMVAFASSATVFMAGRALLGVVIGGFWSMSASTAMRLVPESEVPRALGLINEGNALATTVAAPLGTFLGQYIGWRGAFFAVVPVAAITFAWLYASVPSMPAPGTRRGATVFRVLRRPCVPVGMIAVTLFFFGQFALFTYIRPFLETVTHVDVSTLSLMLLIMGVAGLVGTYIIGAFIKTGLSRVLLVTPLAMAAIACALTVTGSAPIASRRPARGLGSLGNGRTCRLVDVLSRVLPDDAEAGGGLMVAVIQMAIALGAAGGGLLYDARGYSSTFVMSAIALSASALLGRMA